MTTTDVPCTEELVHLIKRCVPNVLKYVPSGILGSHKVYWTTYGLLLLDSAVADTGYYFHNNQQTFVIRPSTKSPLEIGILGVEKDWKTSFADMAFSLVYSVFTDQDTAVKCQRLVGLAEERLREANTFMEKGAVTWIT